jgi:hypothetical protein
VKKAFRGTENCSLFLLFTQILLFLLKTIFWKGLSFLTISFPTVMKNWVCTLKGPFSYSFPFGPGQDPVLTSFLGFYDHFLATCLHNSQFLNLHSPNQKTSIWAATTMKTLKHIEVEHNSSTSKIFQQSEPLA